jgi:hypothetical protein
MQEFVSNSHLLVFFIENNISYTMEEEILLVSAVESKSTGYSETSHPVGKYSLKHLTNTVMVSPGQYKDYRTQIVSYKPQN